MSFGIRFAGLGLCVGLWAGCQAGEPEPRFLRETPEAAGQLRTPASEAPKPVQPMQPPQAAPVSPTPMIRRNPSTPDPLAGKFGLPEATSGLPKKGKLQATIETSLGTIECTLYGDKTPKTVANFVGLARGVRPFWDGKQGAWVKRPLFDATSFHRAISGFMIQGGDHLGDGSGTVGYEIADELMGLKHDRAGLLCMANRGPNTNGGQFFITDGAAPHLTQMNTYTIFGECTPLEVIHAIASAPRPHAMSEKPEPLIPISKVTISRK